MSEVQDLFVEAKQKLDAFEARAVAVAKHLDVDVEVLLERFDHTQLKVAVHRLGLFAAHVEQVIGDLPTKLNLADHPAELESVAAKDDSEPEAVKPKRGRKVAEVPEDDSEPEA